MTSFLRATLWFINGLSDFTHNGFIKASKNFTPGALDVDLKTKTAIVSGATAGLGYVTALELAKRGANVHCLCRNEETGKKAIEEFKKESGNEDVYLHIVDISQPKMIKSFVDKFSTEHTKLDILVNNAGVMVHERKMTPDNLETNFSTNTLGTYYLTKALIPLLTAASPDARVVTVSSGGMYNEKLDTTDLQFEKMKTFDGVKAYAQNKRAQVELTNRWAELYPNINFYSMHPGWCATPGVEKSLPSLYKFKNQLRAPSEGADTIIWAAASEEVKKYPSGSFFQDRKVVGQHLPLSGTQSKPEEVDVLISKLDEILGKIVG